MSACPMRARDELYRRYDLAVAALPAELKKLAGSTIGARDMDDGAMMIYARDGKELVKIDVFDNVTVVYDQKPPEPAPAPQPPVKYASERALMLLAKMVREALAQHADALIAVDDRLKSTEASAVTKSLDAHAYDAMIEISERVDRLEAELKAARADLDERGWRFKGYWRAGTVAKKSEAWVHDGSTFLAIATTQEKPSADSPDWRVIARKGKSA
jgi:hypothetical protein